MSKNNRENRARKKKAAKRKLGGSVAPSAFDDPEARRRLAILYPFILLASAQPYTPDLQLTEGSIILGKSGGTPGYVIGDDAFRIISELQGALGVSLEEILSVLVDAESTGLLELVNWQRLPAETRAQ